MKKCLLFVLIASFIVTSAFAADKPVIGLINKVQAGDPFLMKVRDMAREEAEKQGMELIDQGASSHARADEQLSIMEDFLARKVAGIILIAGDSKMLIPAVQKANAAGIPVVTIDSAVLGGEVVTHIATDNILGSRTGAEMLIEGLKERGITKGKVVCLEGEPGSQTAIDRKEGFHARIGEDPNFEIAASLTGHWTTHGAVEVMEDVLQAHPDVVGVFASSDMMGIGAVQVLKRADKLDDVVVVSYDGLPEGVELVKSGAYYADIAQNAVVMGIKGVQVLAEVINGKDPASIDKFTDSGIIVVKTDNADEFLKSNW
jgi:ribose transport system substrate-binding protein